MTRLRKFEEAGPPQARPLEQNLAMRLKGSRTGRRALACTKLELTGLMAPFDLEVWFGERVGVLGSNGSGKSHFLRLLALGGSDPDKSAGHITTVGQTLDPVAAHRHGEARRAGRARMVRAGARASRPARAHPARDPASAATTTATAGAARRRAAR